MLWDNIKNSLGGYFSLSEYLVTQQEAEASIREGVSFRGTNIIILVLAIFIASLGLNTNSTAVIIGAMLISPLMGPICGAGLAVGIQDFDLLRRSGRNLAAAAGFSVIASTIYFLISPVTEGHSELLARTSPTIYDVLIGFFGGGAGIVAAGSRSKGNVIPGVAIATALMPPLCTVGYGVATWQPQYFIGALYLFLINSVFIAVATFIGVKLMHYKPVQTSNPERARRVQKWIYSLAIITLLPSIYLTYNMLRESRFEINVDNFVEHECHWPDTRVVNVSTDWHSRGGSVITLTLVGRTMPRDSLVTALGSRLGYYNLANSSLSILQGDGPAEIGQNTSAKDVYEASQSIIAAKQKDIDSLRQVISYNTLVSAPELMPEVRVVFPAVRDLAITKAIFAKSDGGSADSPSPTDTVNVALISVKGRFGREERGRLSKYLEARLRVRRVDVVEVPASDVSR